jgi:hypothetical protein
VLAVVAVVLMVVTAELEVLAVAVLQEMELQTEILELPILAVAVVVVLLAELVAESVAEMVAQALYLLDMQIPLPTWLLAQDWSLTMALVAMFLVMARPLPHPLQQADSRFICSNLELAM